MQWDRLFSNKRLGANNETVLGYSLRNEYLRDYDRLIFSSPFRRLQNKTQVFPLPGHVFVHNRLTHSLEVASVGRSLGQNVGEAIIKKYPHESENFHEFYRNQLHTVISTACLAHDIGNPPFGHSGEEAIRNYFENISGEIKIKFDTQLTENQQADFLKFEGNSNTFRLLTHDTLGIHRMSYSTLASIVKYPSVSATGFNKKTGLIATKKAGFFDSDYPKFIEIAKEFNINPISDTEKIYPRHPFVFLVEAADDICYRIIDLEDAFRLGILTKKEVFDLLLNIFDEESITKIKASLAKQSLDNQQLSYLRAMVINQLVSQCTTIFMNNEALLLAGNLNKSLIDILPEKQINAIKKIDEISIKKVYNHKSVIEIELAGFNVIGGLLDEFMNAIVHIKSKKSEKLLALIPEQFDIKNELFYEKTLAVVDFISSMTDLYAIDLFRKIKGISV